MNNIICRFFLRCSLFIGASLVIPFVCGAHGNATVHTREMYSVLPFASEEDGSATRENKAIENLLRYITSELIDNYRGRECEEFAGKSFYQHLNDEYGFHCKHRLLFHWGYNARPWSASLDEKISHYSWSNNPLIVEKFKRDIVTEQARRNRLANAKTEEVFGLSSSGKESAWANGIIAIVYDVHLLGDYVPFDNSDFDGVTQPSIIIGDIINAIDRIDRLEGKQLRKSLSSLSKAYSDEHELAVKVIQKLQTELPSFLLRANQGALKNKFLSCGYSLKVINN